MKILITNTRLEGGGAESSIRNLITFSKDLDIDINLITQDVYRGKYKNKLHSWIKYFFAIRSNALKSDCVISGIEGVNYLFTKFACIGLNIKIIQWIHCNPPDYLKYQNLKNRFALKTALKLSKNNLYASPYYHKNFGKKGIFMPNFVNEALEINKIQRKKIVFCYVGSLSILKRPQLALRAVDLFPNSELFFFGNGILFNLLKKIVDGDIKYQNVFFEGYLKNPWSQIDAGSIVLLPSETEALPMIVVEAINNKCAIIINKFKGYDFFDVNNGLVLPVNFDNSDELKNAIQFASSWTEKDWSEKYKISKCYIDKFFDNKNNLGRLMNYVDGIGL